MARKHVLVEIFDCSRKRYRTAHAYQGLSVDNLRELDIFRQQSSKYHSPFWRLLIPKPGPASHWHWPSKIQHYRGHKGIDVWAIEHPKKKSLFRPHLQGVIMVCPMTSPTGSGSFLLEIKYVVASPANQRKVLWGVKLKPRFSVGAALLELAAAKSELLGFGRAVGLYSLSEAETFYSKAGLKRYPSIRDAEGLVYFEGVL